MTATEIHLMFNHFPVLGTLFGIIILAIGIFKSNKMVNIIGLSFLLFSGFMALPVNKSGENAEHVVEEYPGVSHDQIHEHEELAESAMPLALVMSLLCAFAIYFQIKSHPRARISAYSVLIIALVTFVLMALVAHEGGKIRRPDLRSEVSK